MEQAKEMARVAFGALEDKKGEDTCVIDISHVSVLADYCVISNGNSDSQVRALVDNVEEKMHKAGFTQKQGEGRNGAGRAAGRQQEFGEICIQRGCKERKRYRSHRCGTRRERSGQNRSE